MKNQKCENCGISSKYKTNIEAGLCNYCKNNKKINENKILEFKEIIDDLVNSNVDSPIITALSGGKDSSYTHLKFRERYPNSKIIGIQ